MPIGTHGRERVTAVMDETYALTDEANSLMDGNNVLMDEANIQQFHERF